MKTLKEILDQKGHEVATIAPEATVLDALRFMADKNIGALLVMSEGKVQGLISERDYARKSLLEGRTAPDVPVSEIMTERVVCAALTSSAEECMAVMTEKRVRHLPVLDGNQVVGMVSIGDLVKAIISEQQFLIDQLEHYIAG